MLADEEFDECVDVVIEQGVFRRVQRTLVGLRGVVLVGFGLTAGEYGGLLKIEVKRFVVVHVVCSFAGPTHLAPGG
jgi:hypothetical protein